MFEAMLGVEVGDDVMFEDPTVLELQRRCAELFNKEDALFIATGTMGNLVSAMTHCTERGQEAIMGKSNHMFLYEVGGLAQIAGIHTNTLTNRGDGTIDITEVRENIRNPDDDHMPRTKLICMENSHNRCGGLVIPLSHFQEVRQLADEHGLVVHLDGARILNACIAQGVAAKAYTGYTDSVNMCFSKGLGAPVGSIIAGTADFCRAARKVRKALGGGMRQVGVLAAAALYALDNNVVRLEDDHQRAKQLAKAIKEHGGHMAEVNMDTVHTNIAYFKLLKKDVVNAAQMVERLNQVTDEEKKMLGFSAIVQTLAFSETVVRLVCHINNSTEDIEMAVAKLRYVLEEMNQ
ncbi:uncharacterized protein [Watersipora subatra]|uniref:uncharacterized protein n=1 Tax=Watersipora subatra TaxID=2589382 RepID=UPI00355BA6D9